MNAVRALRVLTAAMLLPLACGPSTPPAVAAPAGAGSGFASASASSAASASGSASAAASASVPAAPIERGLALCLLIDRSGSMSGLRIEMARQAAIAASEELKDDELLEIVAFDSLAVTIIPLREAGQRAANRFDILRIEPGGGTDYLPALVVASHDFDALGGSSGSGAPGPHRHVVLVTDGQAPMDGVLDRVRSMRARRISTSAVGLGKDPDRRFLGQIAVEGGGRAYFVDDPTSLPAVLRSEIGRARP